MEPCTSEPTTGESTHFDNMTQTNLNRNAVLKVLKSHGPRALHLGEICGRLLECGVLTKDTHEHVVRLAPPLIIEREEIDWLSDQLEAALTI